MGRALSCGSLAVMLLVGGCCHVNNLPANLPKVQRVLVVPEIHGGPSVVVETHNEERRGAVGLIGGIAAVAAGAVTYDKIYEAATPERMLAVLQRAFTSQVTAQLKFQAVTDPKEPHDAVLRIAVNNYGIRSLSHGYPPEYFFDAQAELVGVPGDVLLWRDCDWLRGPLSPVIVYGPGSATANAVIGMGVVAGMPMEALTEMFDRIADDAGRVLADFMAADAHEAP